MIILAQYAGTSCPIRWHSRYRRVNKSPVVPNSKEGKASGIITEDDSLTSHAAVIGLRLGVPVIVGVKNATQLIQDGAILTLDMQRGLVYSGAVGGVQTDSVLAV